jgi:sialate O-acetylesterase
MPVPIWGKADPGEKVRVVVWANAKIEGDSVLVWSDKAPDPKAVRYAWADAPFWANLFNKDGLPGLIFRTDEFE